MTSAQIRPFRIDVPQRHLDDLRARLEQTTSAPRNRTRGALSWFWEHKGAFNMLHSQQPQTLAHAITDAPAGLLVWNAQRFDESLDEDFVLTNIMLYWLTGTAGTSIRFYYEDAPGATVHQAHHDPHRARRRLRR